MFDFENKLHEIRTNCGILNNCPLGTCRFVKLSPLKKNLNAKLKDEIHIDNLRN